MDKLLDTFLFVICTLVMMYDGLFIIANLLEWNILGALSYIIPYTIGVWASVSCAKRIF